VDKMTERDINKTETQNDKPQSLIQILYEILLKIIALPVFGKMFLFSIMLEILAAPVAYFYIASNRNLLIEVIESIGIQIKDPEFATFNKKDALSTNTGNPFNICADYTFGSSSEIYPEIVEDNNRKGNFFAHIKFKLHPNTNIGQSYVCFYAEWTSPPVKLVDISKYNGISFSARLNKTKTGVDPKKPLELKINIATPEIKDYAYYEYDFTNDTGLDGSFKTVDIPFSKFVEPPWYKGQKYPPINTKAVFRISFSIKGDADEGALDIDDIKLY
jgi:hypothetical protein